MLVHMKMTIPREDRPSYSLNSDVRLLPQKIVRQIEKQYLELILEHFPLGSELLPRRPYLNSLDYLLLHQKLSYLALIQCLLNSLHALVTP